MGFLVPKTFIHLAEVTLFKYGVIVPGSMNSKRQTKLLPLLKYSDLLTMHKIKMKGL